MLIRIIGALSTGTLPLQALAITTPLAICVNRDDSKMSFIIEQISVGHVKVNGIETALIGVNAATSEGFTFYRISTALGNSIFISKAATGETSFFDRGISGGTCKSSSLNELALNDLAIGTVDRSKQTWRLAECVQQHASAHLYLRYRQGLEPNSAIIESEVDHGTGKLIFVARQMDTNTSDGAFTRAIHGEGGFRQFDAENQPFFKMSTLNLQDFQYSNPTGKKVISSNIKGFDSLLESCTFSNEAHLSELIGNR